MTDEELDALVEALRDVADHAGYVPHLHHTAATAITTLRAQLAEARKANDTYQRAYISASDRANSAASALAAQIEVDAGIIDSVFYNPATDADFPDDTSLDDWAGYATVGQLKEWTSTAIRNQPRAGAAEHGSYDRTALDRYREKVLREAKDLFMDGSAPQMAILALIEKENSK